MRRLPSFTADHLYRKHIKLGASLDVLALVVLHSARARPGLTYAAPDALFQLVASYTEQRSFSTGRNITWRSAALSTGPSLWQCLLSAIPGWRFSDLCRRELATACARADWPSLLASPTIAGESILACVCSTQFPSRKSSLPNPCLEAVAENDRKSRLFALAKPFASSKALE
ncbi:hypothetical protein F1880_008346 [Penicillium rolfsii]|nr:hypothetical protein F1880_008346 [Penicillium rolfsii]